APGSTTRHARTRPSGCTRWGSRDDLRAYIAARLATAVLVILGVSLVSFLLTFLTGDPAEIMLPPGATAEQITAFRVAWGFDDPLPVQYWRFLSRAVHGDFGVSLRHGQALLHLDPGAVAG